MTEQEKQQQQYGGVVDDEQLAWLRRNYAPLPKTDNTPGKQGERRAEGNHHGN